MRLSSSPILSKSAVTLRSLPRSPEAAAAHSHSAFELARSPQSTHAHRTAARLDDPQGSRCGPGLPDVPRRPGPRRPTARQAQGYFIQDLGEERPGEPGLQPAHALVTDTGCRERARRGRGGKFHPHGAHSALPAAQGPLASGATPGFNADWVWGWAPESTAWQHLDKVSSQSLDRRQRLLSSLSSAHLLQRLACVHSPLCPKSSRRL